MGTYHSKPTVDAFDDVCAMSMMLAEQRGGAMKSDEGDTWR